MKQKKESPEIDLSVDPRPLTEEEQKAISDYIRTEKQKGQKSKKEILRPTKPFHQAG
jgi:hypothetical protein